VIPPKTWVLIKGAGDLGTGVAARLWRCGFGVILAEIAEPTVIRRTVAFAEAVYAGRAVVEGIEEMRVRHSMREGVRVRLVARSRYAPGDPGQRTMEAVVGLRNAGDAP